MKITQPGYLYELTTHKDLPRLCMIQADLPKLQQQLHCLKNRMDKNRKSGVSHSRMDALYERMDSFHKKLSHVNKFWNAHALFFTTHEYLIELSDRYSHYDYNNVDAVRMQIRGNSASKSGDAYTYPFKTFASTLAQDIANVQDRLKNLRKKAHSFSDREIIAQEYYTMISQSEPFCQSLIYLRDVVAGQPEYAKEMKQYEKAAQKAADRLAQERAAAERAKAEKEKADAMRYQAQLQYHAKMNQQKNTNVTVVNQTAPAQNN